MSPRLAVIMSLYWNDTLGFVSMATQSVLAQSFSSFDFYIQFDGPVKKEIDDYLSSLSDCRIHLYRREENRGLAQSLNDLLSVVLPQGYEFIARMDADDVCVPDRFQKQMEYLNTHSEIDCLGTWAIEIDSKGDEFYRKRMPEHHDDCLSLFRKRDCIIHPTAMFRRSFFEKAGLYSTDTYFAEDTMMWAKGFASGCHFGNVPEYLYLFRLDDSFFYRRRGWKHAKGIVNLRKRVNRMLNFGIIEDFYAYAYAAVKLLPTKLLSWVYRKAR